MTFNIFFAEAFGTFILVLLGNGTVAQVVLKKSKGFNSGWIVIATGWALAVATAVYITAPISGAHINPAVTISLAVAGMFSWNLVFGYIIAQLIGAILGGLVVFLTYKKQYDEEEDSGSILATFSTGPSVPNTFWNIVTEAVGTMILLLGIIVITSYVSNPAVVPALVGMVVWAIGIALGGPTGYAINPARDLGPRIAHAILPIPNKGASDWKYGLVVPIIGPIVGGIIGTFLGIYVVSLM